MAGNSFGDNFKITTFGESHGKGVGVVIDGCPPRLPISSSEIQNELNRRRPGQSKLTTPRQENDIVSILSGVENDQTLGSPISLTINNEDQIPNDYGQLKTIYRPSHADATYDFKYGIRSMSGGGRSSARETIGRVAAGTIAKKVLKLFSNVDIVGYVHSVHNISISPDRIIRENITREMVDQNIIRCPDPITAEMMIERIEQMKNEGNSAGGIIEVVVKNVPSGWGSPVFNKLEAELAKACLSIPATKGFEIGSGFEGTKMTGKEHNDEFFIDPITGKIRTRTNKSGGIQGGISNGETIYLRVGFKPTSTISMEQNTVTSSGEETILKAKGRHDPCVLPRAVPIVEAMVAIVLVNALMDHTAQCRIFHDNIGNHTS